MKKSAYCMLLLGIGMALALSGCHSPWVAATIMNEGPALHVLELDYPSASFGVDVLAAGGQYRYRFKIRGSGPVTLHFEDSAGKDHTSAGPTLNQGQEGSLTVTIGAQNQVHWSLKLSMPH